MTRKTARENAFLLLFEKFIKGDESADEIFTKATEVRELECDDYVRAVFFGSTEHREKIDAEIEKALVGWRKTRLSNVSLALLTLSTYELMFMDDIPARVSINEAIELSKKYDDEKAYSLVNGVLNAVAESLSRK